MAQENDGMAKGLVCRVIAIRSVLVAAGLGPAQCPLCTFICVCDPPKAGKELRADIKEKAGDLWKSTGVL